MTECRAPHRVVLVREWDQQVGGSGCCGRFGSDAVAALNDAAADPYARARSDMRRMGAVYEALRERFPPDEVELVVADPRNTAWLLPATWRAARRRGLSRGEALRQVNAATATCAVSCDGVVVATDPTPAEAVAAVAADLANR